MHERSEEIDVVWQKEHDIETGTRSTTGIFLVAIPYHRALLQD